MSMFTASTSLDAAEPGLSFLQSSQWMLERLGGNVPASTSRSKTGTRRFCRWMAYCSSSAHIGDASESGDKKTTKTSARAMPDLISARQAAVAGIWVVSIQAATVGAAAVARLWTNAESSRA
jgi:hypothetical protein